MAGKFIDFKMVAADGRRSECNSRKPVVPSDGYIARLASAWREAHGGTTRTDGAGQGTP